ncbi:BtaA family protein [Rhodopirellula sp. JC740]|uniref:BtaA family protein n=1 Tax=Rhodopirellula halodulae TaxID=2894198 RepID=A0ABS8NKD2_9BACT|nr:BtaA family protein [Rhodopirellula sp. JC740]MCC9643273.1 BtaA family protein [Rhodopirellula sp. JC740]
MVANWLGNKCFKVVHQKNLVYNTCWEDPRLDRQALSLGQDDSVLVITSAGCNALDYALESPRSVHAVDMNPLQNALLELKCAAIRTLNYEDFFQVFGRGVHANWQSLYNNHIRASLAPDVRSIWDRRSDFFDGTSRRKSFYFRGTSGLFAWLINGYLKRPAGLKEAIGELLQAESVDQQRQIYQERNINQLLWSKPLRWALRRDTTLAMLGVPRSQRKQLDQSYPGGIGGFIQDRIEAVFKTLPLRDNYFWRVYLTGRYTPECCPEYLKEENFQRLKSGLVDRVHTHTNTVEGFLTQHDERVSRFVLLDHMDWLYDRYPELLASEWQSILNRATSDARVLWRSAALTVDFVDPLKLQFEGNQVQLGDLLHYHQELATSLHARDRVHTYGSFYIADLFGPATSNDDRILDPTQKAVATGVAA